MRASTQDTLLKSRTRAMEFSGSILAGDPKGAQLPAAPKEARKLPVYGTIQMPAMTPSNSNTREAKESYCMPLHTTNPHCMYVCAQLVHRNCSGGNQDESQTDSETEKGPNRQLLVFLFCSVHFIGNFLYLAH